MSIIRISTLLAPTALHRLAVDVCVVYRYDGVRGRLLGGKPEIEREEDLGLSPGRVFRRRWCWLVRGGRDGVYKKKSPLSPRSNAVFLPPV